LALKRFDSPRLFTSNLSPDKIILSDSLQKGNKDWTNGQFSRRAVSGQGQLRIPVGRPLQIQEGYAARHSALSVQ
jgi:hypothetical protein